MNTENKNTKTDNNNQTKEENNNPGFFEKVGNAISLGAEYVAESVGLTSSSNTEKKFEDSKKNAEEAKNIAKEEGSKKVEEAKESYNKNKEDVKEKTEQLKEEGSKKYNETKEDVKEKTEQLKEEGSKKVEEAKESYNKNKEDVKEKTEQLKEEGSKKYNETKEDAKEKTDELKKGEQKNNLNKQSSEYKNLSESNQSNKKETKIESKSESNSSLKELLSNFGNMTCADCNNNEIKSANTIFGIFLCCDCGNNHNRFFSSFSKDILCLEKDTVSSNQLKFLEKGGNYNFSNFINSYGIQEKTTNLKIKYLNKAVCFYKSYLESLVKGEELKSFPNNHAGLEEISVEDFESKLKLNEDKPNVLAKEGKVYGINDLNELNKNAENNMASKHESMKDEMTS